MSSQGLSFAGNPRKSLGKSFLAAAALAWYLSSEEDESKPSLNVPERSASASTSTEAIKSSEEAVTSAQMQPTFLGRPLSTFRQDRSNSSLSRYYSPRRTRIPPRPQSSRSLLITGRSYANEFLELGKLGSGAFGSVFRSQNVLDGTIYAIKKVTLPLKLPGQRHIDDLDRYPPPDELMRFLREPQAMANVGYHRNLVRYHNAWIEASPTGKKSKKSEESRYTLESSIPKFSESTSSLSSQFSSDGSNDDWNDGYSDDDSVDGMEEASGQAPPSASDHSFVLFIQMELCSGASLYDWLRLTNRKINVEENQRLFKQLIQGILHLHSRGYCHRDVKPANLLIVPKNGDNKLKVGDFGCCKRIEDEEKDQNLDRFSSPRAPSSRSDDSSSSSSASNSSDLTEGCGTFFYMAPELHTQRYDLKVDLFAAGIVLFELYQVFSTEMERNSLLTDLHEKRLVPRSFLATYPEVAALVLKLTHSDPNQRPSAYDLLNDPRYGLCPIQYLDPIEDLQ